MAQPENKFPTILDAKKALEMLIDKGFGDCPIQVIVSPDSTIQAIGIHESGEANNEKPVLMVEFLGTGKRMPVIIMSADRLSDGGGMATLKTQ